MLYKVKDNPDLYRLSDSNAIINNDSDSLSSYKLKKEKDRKLSNIFEEHENIKSELSEIKLLILKLLGNNN